MGGDIEEYPFIFMNTPASLQMLASAEMALMVWRYKYANTRYFFASPSSCFDQKLSCNEVLVVPVPPRIQAQINEKIPSIGEELNEWIYFHSDLDFLFVHSTAAFGKCFKHIVVDFSGSIGCKASAMNMLNSGEFSDVVNYKIACTYCLEDQVKRFWPSVAWVADDLETEGRYGIDTCHLSYWIDWMKSGENSITDIRSVLRLAKKAAYRGNDAAFDYFFSKMLPDHESVSEFISLLDDEWYHSAVMHSLLFRTLNRVQAEEVFKMQASSIFRVLTKYDKNFQCAHRLWHLMGHLCLENESIFYNVVCELWRLVFIFS